MPVSSAAIADDQPVRDPDELRIGEFHAGPRVAIVEQHVDAGGAEILVQLVGRAAHALGFLVVDRHHDDVEGSQRLGPDDAVGIVILLDGRRDDAGHADAVAAHEHGDRLALLVEDGRLHGLAVELPELEDVADFDAARDLERAIAGRARIARHDVADVHGSRLGQIASPVHAGEVHVLLVGAADEIGELRRGVVDVDRAAKTHRAE